MGDVRKNTPELWDEIWDKPLSQQHDLFALAKEEHSVRWRRIGHEINRVYPKFEKLKSIEIGAGSGTYAALLAQRGAQVTILDYSDKALDRAREFFGRNGLTADFVKQDALSLSPALLDCFDVSMSFGLIEHFQGTNRQQIVQVHFDVLKSGGLTFISVPNKFCPPYRLFKSVAQRTGKWPFGEEYPTSRGELAALAKRSGASMAWILGSSLFSSFDFVNPLKAFAIVRRILRLKDNLDTAKLRPERGTFLDSYLSYALILAAHKA